MACILLPEAFFLNRNHSTYKLYVPEWLSATRSIARLATDYIYQLCVGPCALYAFRAEHAAFYNCDWEIMHWDIGAQILAVWDQDFVAPAPTNLTSLEYRSTFPAMLLPAEKETWPTASTERSMLTKSTKRSPVKKRFYKRLKRILTCMQRQWTEYGTLTSSPSQSEMSVLMSARKSMVRWSKVLGTSFGKSPGGFFVRSGKIWGVGLPQLEFQQARCIENSIKTI